LIVGLILENRRKFIIQKYNTVEETKEKEVYMENPGNIYSHPYQSSQK
jgi:hypothetical protein